MGGDERREAQREFARRLDAGWSGPQVVRAWRRYREHYRAEHDSPRWAKRLSRWLADPDGLAWYAPRPAGRPQHAPMPQPEPQEPEDEELDRLVRDLNRRRGEAVCAALRSGRGVSRETLETPELERARRLVEDRRALLAAGAGKGGLAWATA